MRDLSGESRQPLKLRFFPAQAGIFDRPSSADGLRDDRCWFSRSLLIHSPNTKTGRDDCPPALQGRAAVVRMGALEGVGDAQQKMLAGYGANELQADRQTRGSKPAGDGHSRDAREVGGAIQA